MPIIRVELFEGRTREQKEAFTQAVTKAAVEILKAPQDHTWVVFSDHKKSDWGMGGKLCDR